MQEYADPVIDWLDAGQGILRRRLFREVCAPHRVARLSSAKERSHLGLPAVLYPAAKWVVHQEPRPGRTRPFANLPRRQFADLLQRKRECVLLPLVVLSVFFSSENQRRVSQ